MRIAALFLLLFTLLAADHDNDHERHLPLDISYLDLSHEQHEKVERIVRHHQEAHQRFNHQKKRHREAIGRLFTAETFDHEKFMELTAELRNEAGSIQARFLQEIHAVLTPKQRRNFARYMEEWEIE